MKRFIVTMFCLVLVLSLFGCGKAKSGDYPATIMVNGTNFNRDTGATYKILSDGMVVVLIDNEWIEFKAK